MNRCGRRTVRRTQELNEVREFLFVRVHGSRWNRQPAVETKPFFRHPRETPGRGTRRSSSVRPAISGPGAARSFNFVQSDCSKCRESQEAHDPQHYAGDGAQIVGTIALSHEVEEVLFALLQARRCSVALK